MAMAQVFRGRRRRWILIAVGAIILLIILLNVLSGFYIDLLWFREVHFSGVFWTIFWTKVLLGLIFGVLFFVLLYVNLLIVRRLTPTFRVFSPEQEIIERYRVAVEPYVKWILPAFSALIALFVGIGAAGKWQTFLLWKNSGGVNFSTPGHDLRDPVFHRDPSFYIFHLPWLHFLQGWLFSSLVGIGVICAIGHYLWGGIRVQATGERVTPQVKAHLSVLLGLIVLVKAWGYWLGRYDLVTGGHGVVNGAGYTDIHARMPALILLVFIAIGCAVAFLVNIRFRGWALPAIAIGVLALASIVAGAIIPAAIQKFSVSPQQLQREQPFITRNIDATRRAFQLGGIKSTDTNPTPDISQADLTAESTTVSNIRLWDPAILKDNYDQLQRIRQYYEFADADVDRYRLNGQERMVMVSAREVVQSGIPGTGRNWQNQHLVYTHGFGFVASQVNTSASDGSPDFIETNIPSTGRIALSQQGQRVYFGEQERDVPFVVVNTGVPELDYQTDTHQQAAPPYVPSQGYEGGINVGGFFNRVLFAWRFKDLNLLISGLIHGDSRMLIFRDLSERIPKAAPFLQYDGDPYSAVVNRRIVWIQDAYTTTDAYPYSQEVNLGGFTAGLHGQANYIRNSVKVVVDAYTGQMHYYVADPTDPIIQVWMKTFPDLFTPFADAPLALRAHFRYPEDLFSVQAEQFARYHVVDPSVFFQNQDLWVVPADPSGISTTLRPYYLLLQLPGESGVSFHLIQPFTPSGRNNMVAWMTARSDYGSGYGKIVSFEFPAGENVNGPLQVHNLINSDPTFSSFRTLVSRVGSNLRFGNFLVIPIGNGFLYVEPVFVQGSSAGSFPQLKRVLAVHGGTVGIGNTLAGALANSFGQAPPPPSGPPPTGTVGQRVKALLAQAVAEFQAADAALKRGDLATYAADVAKAEALIKQAEALASGTPVPTPTPTLPPTPAPSPSTRGSPSPSPS